MSLLFAFFLVCFLLLFSCLAPFSTSGSLNSQTISSNGEVEYASLSLTIESFPNPSRIDQEVIASGAVTDSLGNGRSGVLVTIQYSGDKQLWENSSTTLTDGAGTFQANLTFSSSGIYYLRGVYDKLASQICRQVIASSFVGNDGTEDFADIQAAIDALPPQGGVVYVKSGIYDLDGKTIVVRSNLTLIGDGIDKTIIRLYPTQHSEQKYIQDGITSVSDIDNLTIENLTLTQNLMPVNNHGCIFLRGGQNNNITIRDFKAIGGSGVGIGVPNFLHLSIQGCVIEQVWTGIVCNNGSDALILENTVKNTVGDAILFSIHATDVAIENNNLENIGDTAIDVTSLTQYAGNLPHERFLVRNNTVINGTLRISNSGNVQILGNRIQNGEISVDAGQATPFNISIVGNYVVSGHKAGIGFYGALDSSAINNTIVMESPPENMTQSGMIVAIWGVGLIENNTLLNAANFGVDFGGWGLGGSSNITIRKNTIQGFHDIGIYDDAKNQGSVHVEQNAILSDEQAARWGICTEFPNNQWLIDSNALNVAGLIGNQAINAPSSTLIANH